MYYPVSATIVAEHPDLEEQVKALDGFLEANRGEVVRPDRVLDHVDIEAPLLGRLLALYERVSAIRPVTLHLCPDCDQPLADDFECDICERNIAPRTALSEQGYEAADRGPPKATTPEGVAEMVRDVLDPEVRGATIQIGELHMGDRYSAGQAGAMGPGASASNMTFQQVWNQFGGNVDLDALVGELAKLRGAMKAEGTTADHDVAVADVAKAEKAARDQDGPRVLQHLKSAGKWALEVSTKIGTAIATELIKRGLTST